MFKSVIKTNHIYDWIINDDELSDLLRRPYVNYAFLNHYKQEEDLGIDLLNNIEDHIDITRNHYKQICANPYATHLFDYLSYADMRQASYYLSNNRNAFHILLKNTRLIDRSGLLHNANPKAIEIIKQKKYNLSCTADWNTLLRNESDEALDFIEECLNKEYRCLMGLLDNKNPRAIILFEKFYNKYKNTDIICDNLYINYAIHLSYIESYEAIRILQSNTELFKHIPWFILAKNKYAIELLQNNLDKIYWYWNEFMHNKSDKMVEIMKQNYDKINWEILCSVNDNPKVIDFIIDEYTNGRISLNKICTIVQNKSRKAMSWVKDHLCKDEKKTNQLFKYYNNNSFNNLLDHQHEIMQLNIIGLCYDYDYQQMRLNCKSFCEELVAYVLYPNRIQKMCEIYGEEYLNNL